jgi:hypothetical protein
MANNEMLYSLPVSGSPGEYVTHDPSLPNFANFIHPDYIFNPSKISDLGFSTIKGKLWN